MPLTPRFELSQTATHVIVTIFVPTVRVTNIEVIVEESTFYFHATPYLLQLQFAPHKFHTDDNNGPVSAEYDPSSQQIRVPLRKAQVGLEWPHLDLTARLLAPKEIPRQWLHAVTSETNNHTASELNEDKDECSDDDIQSPHPLGTTGIIPRQYGYGFGGIFQNIFTDYCRAGLAQEMLQLPNPETTEPIERRHQRIQQETTDFDADRYIQDVYLEEDYLYPLVMDYSPFWSNPLPTHSDTTIDHQLSSQLEQISLHSSSHKKKEEYFNDDERLQLATIPYPLLPPPLKSTHEDSTLWPGLLDLLVPFVYDHLTTMGDPTVESSWTITTLSSSLSWLDPPTTISDAIITLTRRMLVYPYWRNYDFAMSVWNHTLTILQSGLYTVVKALLQTRTILEKSESYYVGNKLYVDPYLYWIQNHTGSTIPSKIIHAVEEALQSSTIRLKESLNLGLVDLEEANIEVSTADASDREDTESHHDQESESEHSHEDDSSSSSDTAESSNNNENNGEKDIQSQCHEDEPDATNPPIVEIQVARSSNQPQLLDDVVGTSTSMLEIVAAPLVDTNNGGRNGTLLAKKTGPLVWECE